MHAAAVCLDYEVLSMAVLSLAPHQGLGHACEDCDSSCLECRGPGSANCTMCPTQAILEAGGRCLLCCRVEEGEEEEEEEEATTQQQDCCNCTETRGRSMVLIERKWRRMEMCMTWFEVSFFSETETLCQGMADYSLL